MQSCETVVLWKLGLGGVNFLDLCHWYEFSWVRRSVDAHLRYWSSGCHTLLFGNEPTTKLQVFWAGREGPHFFRRFQNFFPQHKSNIGVCIVLTSQEKWKE